MKHLWTLSVAVLVGCGGEVSMPPGQTGSGGAGGSTTWTISACEEGFYDCDGEPDNGCEAELGASEEHCGTCGNACATECKNGACNDPVEVSAGASYTCVIRASGSVWCWGDNEWGNIGVTAPESILPRPQRIELPGPAMAVATGKLTVRRHTCALLVGGAVYCWGANGNGQLGTGDGMDSFTPLPVELPETKRIAVGGKHTCAVSNDYQLWCWGSNGSGEIGSGMASPDEPSPKLILNSTEEVALGGQHTCARDFTGDVHCWGSSSSNQLGIGSSMNSVFVPLQIDLSGGATELGLGVLHSCARLEDDAIKCWGEGGVGQLGLGSLEIESLPALVLDRGVSSLAIGAASSSAIIDGEVWAWGLNADGQLGLGHLNPVLTPALTKIGAVTKISLGDRHGCAIRPSGELACWGANDKGQLGTGDIEPSLDAVAVVFPPESGSDSAAPEEE